MSSVVAICNLALAHIRGGTINSIDEASAQARACKQHYDQTRRALLASYPWGWAQKRETLAAVTNDRTLRWAYAYARPADCVHFIGIADDGSTANEPDPAAHEIVGRTIYAALSPGVAIYTADQTDPTKYPPLFIDAFAAALAARIALQITGDRALRNDTLQLAKQTFDAAAAADANEDTDRPDYVPEMIAARA
jgi:hypothetical protein